MLKKSGALWWGFVFSVSWMVVSGNYLVGEAAKVESTSMMEVEIKFQLDDENKKIFEAWLATAQGLTKSELEIEDCYFDKPGSTFERVRPEVSGKASSNNFRIRFENGLAMQCTKVKTVDLKTGVLNGCDEKITEFASLQEAHQAVQALLKDGYAMTQLLKLRTTYRFGDFEIDCDHMVAPDSLVQRGDFFEVELKDAKEADYANGRKRIVSFLRDVVGLKVIKTFKTGYITMAWFPEAAVVSEEILQS